MKRKLFALTLLLILGVFPALAQDGTTLNNVQFNGFGFSFDSALAMDANISQYPGDSPDVQQPGGPQPPYLQFNLYTGLPVPQAAFDAPISAQVYAIADLAAYPDSLAQATALQALLTQRPDLASYMVVPSDGSMGTPLPYLPIMPATQAIRAQAHYTDTPVLQGISYITAFRQDVSPFLNNNFLYTFQGLSNDGLYYVSFVSMITAPGFPPEVPADFDDAAFAADYTAYLTQSVATLNAASPDAFVPALTALDALPQSFTISVGTTGDGTGTVVVPPTPSDPTLGGLANMLWTLVSYGPDDAPVAALPGVPVTATFSAEGVAGTGGCNSYSGQFTYNQGTIQFGPLISTRMACAEDVMNQESAYFSALETASTYAITGDQLQIGYEGGVLTFAGTGTGVVPPTAFPAPSDPTLGGLANTVWTLVSYGPADAPVAVLPAAPVTATFSAEGVAGTGGCNSYSGTFTYDDGTISFGPLISTQMACAEDVMNQESAYFSALATASTYAISNGQLQINYEGGVLTFAGTPTS